MKTFAYFIKQSISFFALVRVQNVVMLSLAFILTAKYFFVPHITFKDLFTADSILSPKEVTVRTLPPEETHFSKIKAVLQSLLRIGFNIKCETKTLSKHTLFSQGRVAEIVANKKTVGYIGELDSKVLENFRIRTKVVGFEIKLSGLIFD